MSIMNPEGLAGKIVLGLIRHAIVSASTVYVAQGVISHDQQQQMVGGLMVAVGIAMSVYDKMQQTKGKTDE